MNNQTATAASTDINFTNPQFICSVGANKAPEELHYIAFAGRSNVGKSSVINALCGGRYARVAKTPGRTRLINLFRLGNGSATLADLPGYGYAAVSKEEQRSWAPRMTRFLSAADIRCLAVIIDCRRGIGELDKQLFELFAPREAPILLIFNKIDKLTRQQQHSLKKSAEEMTTAPIILFSALKKTGVAEVRQYISSCLSDCNS